MITVTILINGQPIFTRSARRQQDEINNDGINTYKTDSGEIIEHQYDDGAVKLAKKLLDTIDEEM